MGRYTSGAVQIHTVTSGSAIKIGGITNLAIPTNAETISDDSGSLYDEVRSLASHAPVPSFTTKSIAAVLDQIGIAGQCIDVDGSHLGVYLFGRKLGMCDDPVAGSDHIQWLLSAGLMKLGTLTANRGTDAEISVMIEALTDGTNAPVRETDGVALPTPLISQQFTLGVCKVGGVVFSEIQGVSIDFGVGITEKLPALASVWPNSVGVQKVRPVLTLRGRDLSQIKAAAIPVLGAAATHVNTTIQLVKRLNAGTFESAGSTVHITLTMAGMITPQSLISASGQSEGEHEIRIEGVHDGTNVPILIDTTSAYDSTP